MKAPTAPAATAPRATVGTARFARVEDLFVAALDQPADRREAWLVAACAGDDALVAEVLDLLALDARDSPHRLRPPAERLVADDELAEGALIDGRYRIGPRLGAGGLGVVHRAEQLAPVRRAVALKVGRRGLDDGAALALFLAESRALSRVSHPGIAQVYDAGRTARGRFYVAMELVDGEPLTAYCARHALDLDARLDLFIDVCRAVQHAHQRGVIHRDLKPSNVLVTRHGEVAWPKVIDFGVALAAGADLSGAGPDDPVPDDRDPADLADTAQPVAGTPAYMSPEQAQAGAADVDTRADVYSLGVMLYELLTGTLPFATGASTRRDLGALDAVLRGPLVPPSARVPTRVPPSARGSSSGRVAPSAPASPSTPSVPPSAPASPSTPSVPPIARAALRGDLDAVVAKAMAYDRTARYATVSELAADLDRVSRQAPVSARPHTAAYLLGSFVRRHRLLVAAVSLLLVGVLSAGIVMARLSSEEAEQRRIAEREAATAQAQRELAQRTAKLADRLRARSLLMAAATALESGDAGTTLTNLDAIPAAHRGWEWRYLHLEADRSALTLSPGPVSPAPASPAPASPAPASPAPASSAPASPAPASPAPLSPAPASPAPLSPGPLADSGSPSVSAHTATPRPAAITTLAAASSAPLLAAGDAEGTVRVWRLDDPGAPRVWHAQEGAASVLALALSPDGRLVATSDLASAARVWEVDSGALLWERPGVVSLGRGAFSPDGARLALGVFGDHAVSIHDARKGQVLDRVPLVMPTAYRPTWVGGGALLVTDLSRTQRVDLASRVVAWLRPARLVEPAGPDRFIGRTLPNYVGWSLFDATTGAELRVLPDRADANDLIEALDVSPDGAWTATAGATVLGLSGAPEGGPTRRQALPGHAGAVTALVFAHRGRSGEAASTPGQGGQGAEDLVFTGDTAGVVKGWSTTTAPQPYIAPRSNDVIFVGAASPDGALVVTGGWGSVKCWDAVLGAERWTRPVGRAYVSALAFSGGTDVAPRARLVGTAAPASAPVGVAREVLGPGGTVAVGDWRGVVRVLDLIDGAELARVELGAVRVFALAWAPDGRLVAGREDGRVDVIDPWSGRVERSVAAHGSAIRALAFSPDGGLLASGSGDGAVWPVINEERPNEGADASVRLWRWPGLEPAVVMSGHGASVRSLAFAPDGARLVSGGSDRTLKTWSVPGGELLGTRVGVGHEVTAVAFTADGSRLVTAHGEGPLLIWDAVELELLATLPGGHGHVLWAGFSARGDALLAVSRQRALVRFETDRDPARDQARAEVQAARAALDRETGALSAEELAARVTARPDLSSGVVRRAVAMTYARGDHALMLNSAAWGRVLTPGESPAALAEALQASTTAVKARPNDWMIWSTLALARYRTHDLAGALIAADQAIALQQTVGRAEDPLGDAVRVLILAGLGRLDEARRLLDATRPAMQREDTRLDHEAWALFAEAEAALAGPHAPR